MNTGKVTGVISNLIFIEAHGAVTQNKICLIETENKRLMAELIRITGTQVSAQLFETSMYQGKVCASSIYSIGSGNDVFGRDLILAVFPELYAIIAFASLFLIRGIL